MHFYPENFRINAISNHLANIYENVYVITGHPNYPKGKFFKGYNGKKISFDNFNKVKIIRVPIFPRGNKSKKKLFLNYFSFLISSFFLSPFLLYQKKINSIFIYGTSPLLQGISAIPLKIFKNAKLNLWVQDLWPDDLVNTGYFDNKSIFVLTINKFLIKILYNSCNKIFIQSKGFQREIESYVKNKGQFYYLPNPTESSSKKNIHLQHLPLRIKKFYDGSFNLLFTGNIGNNQSIDTIIKSAIKLRPIKNIRILIVGDGNKYEYLKKQIRSYALKNIFALGRYPLHYMNFFYFISDACYVSLASLGSLPLTVPAKIQEYMFAKKPIIASMNGEGSKLIKFVKCGLVSPSNDPINLTKNIIKLSQLNYDTRKTMGKRGFNYAKKNFDINVISQNIIDNLS